MCHRKHTFLGIQDFDGETTSLWNCSHCKTTRAIETAETILDYIRDSYQSLPAAAFYTDEAP